VIKGKQRKGKLSKEVTLLINKIEMKLAFKILK
jgi:hypothetical protein